MTFTALLYESINVCFDPNPNQIQMKQRGYRKTQQTQDKYIEIIRRHGKTSYFLVNAKYPIIRSRADKAQSVSYLKHLHRCAKALNKYVTLCYKFLPFLIVLLHFFSFRRTLNPCLRYSGCAV